MTTRMCSIACACATAVIAAAGHAQVSVIQSFNVPGTPVGLAYDVPTDEVLVYIGSQALVRRYTPAGTEVGSFARPGESADDADLDFAPVNLVMGSTKIAAGTLLFINGESGVAEIYAVNKVSGAVLATLTTAYGNSHVVGGGYHPERTTFFLVQDRNAGGGNGNRVAEINAQTGAIINSFLVTAAAPDFSVNYGDLDISPNGNLLITSSDETGVLELTPDGAFVALTPFPAGVGALSGLGVGDGTCDVWCGSTSGTISSVRGFYTLTGISDFNDDGVVNSTDVSDFINAWFADQIEGTFLTDWDGNGVVNSTDVSSYINDWFADVARPC